MMRSATWVASSCGRVLQQDRELVTAKPRRRVTGAHSSPSRLRDLDQQAVACRMTEAVVDELEVVDIEEEDPDLAGVPRAGGRGPGGRRTMRDWRGR